MIAQTSFLTFPRYQKQLAEMSQFHTYFSLNQRKKRQSASQSRVLFAPVVLKERSAWTTRSENKYLTEYGQAQRLRSEDLGKDAAIAKQGESIALKRCAPCILLGDHLEKSQQL